MAQPHSRINHLKIAHGMKKNLPLIVIIASAILMIFNFITTEELDRRFWISTLSSILIIISMLLTLKARKKNE